MIGKMVVVVRGGSSRRCWRRVAGDGRPDVDRHSDPVGDCHVSFLDHRLRHDTGNQGAERHGNRRLHIGGFFLQED